MLRPGYTIKNSADQSLTATVAKTILGVKSGAAFGLQALGLTVSFKGVTANPSVLVELCRTDWATNAPGTNSTSVTPTQDNGRTIAAGFTAAETWTTEPTVLTVLDQWEVTPNGGLLVLNFGDEGYDCDLAQGFVLRLTDPTTEASIVRASLRVARI